MALLQDGKAVFYHPLEDAVEAVEAKTWAGSPDFTDGEIGRSMTPAAGSADASLTGLTADYGSAAAAVKVAFAGWLHSPSGKAGAPAAGSAYVPAPSDPGPPTHVVNIVSAAALDSGKFVVVWQDSATSEVRAVAGAVSGTTVSFGSAVTIDGAAPESVSAAALTSTKFLACYTHTADLDLSAAVCTVSGLDITFGEPHRLASDSAHNIQCVALTSTLAVCTFIDDVTPPLTSARAVALTVSGTDVTFGTAVALGEAGVGTSLSVAKLTDTTFIQILRAASFGNRGRAMIGTVAGGAITFGDFTPFSEDDNRHPIGDFDFVCALDSTHVAVVYKPSTGGARAVIGVVSGTTVSFGEWKWVTFEEEGVAATFDRDAENCRVAALDSTRFLVAYTENGDGDHLSARVGVLTGGDISFGAVLDVNGAQTHAAVALAALSSTTAVVAATQTTTAPDTIDAYVLTVSGLDVTKGAKATVHTFNTTGPSLAACALDSAHAVLAFRDGGDSNKGKAVLGTVAEAAISFSADCTFNSAATDSIATAALTSSVAVVCYRDVGDGSDGHAAVLTSVGGELTAGAEYAFQTGDANVDYVAAVGLDSLRFAVAYFDDPHGYLRVGTVGGAAISFGAASEFRGSADIALVKLAKIGTDRLALAYGVNGVNSSYVECAVSGYSASFGPTTEWYAGGVPTAGGNASADMSAAGGQAVVVYRDAAGPGTAVTNLSFRITTRFKCEALDPTHFAVAVIEGGAAEGYGVLKVRVATVSSA